MRKKKKRLLDPERDIAPIKGKIKRRM